jgi:hypothetical protein
LEHTANFVAARITAPAMKEPEGLPRLKALVNHWFGWAGRAGLPGGCPVAAGMLEYDDVESPVRDKVKEMEAEWRGLLASLVAQAIQHGHLRHDLDADQFVWELFGIYLSHHVASRFLKSPVADHRAQTAFAALLARVETPRRRQGVQSRRGGTNGNDKPSDTGPADTTEETNRPKRQTRKGTSRTS